MLLYQPTKGYAYNSDSIFLYDFIYSFRPKGELLDVGCGVGVISLLLSRDFNIKPTIIDKQRVMLEYAERNFKLNGFKFKSYLGDFREVEIPNSFDFIISNPPFYSSSVIQSQDEVINIARYSHHLPIDGFVQKVKSLLKPRGRFILCYDAKQVDKLLFTMIKYKINPEVLRFVHPKIDREAKLVMIMGRINSKSMTKILPPLIVFDTSSNYQREAKGAFERASTHSIKGDMDV
jgi:tRNA1(Val) A37 N6-methylase TrmN6